MPREVEIGAVVNSLELVPAEWELVLDVVRVLRVVGELVLRMLVKAQLVPPDPESVVPLHPLLFPEFEPLAVRARLHEELHLHLLEFPGPEYEVPGRDLVAERFPNLRNAERDSLP